MNKVDVKRKVDIAIDEFMNNDIMLLENKASERAVTHRLAVYLEKQFAADGWQVDCEYNRVGLDEYTIKRVDINGELSRSRRVFPDIIVHKRGEQENLLVIEVKTGKTNKKKEDFDRLKLRGYKRQHRLGYTLALFLKFTHGSTQRPLLEWI